LLPTLYEHFNPLTRLESLRQERNVARRLRRLNYWVLTGRDGRKSGLRTERTVGQHLGGLILTCSPSLGRVVTPYHD
jgi:hypothetical protein